MSKAIEANSKFFDQLASTYSSEVIRYVSQEVADYILKDQAAHINADSSILDYACGGGDISLTFKPLVKSVSGADVSAGMLENFTKRAALTDQGSAHTFLIKDGKLPEQAGPFDLIIVSVLHPTHLVLTSC